jgi:VRR-NUC domain
MNKLSTTKLVSTPKPKSTTKLVSTPKPKSESSEQTARVTRVRHFHPDLVFMSIPNGGKRDPRVAAQMKREGVLAGAPDLFLAEPRPPYCGLFIEMKKIGGKTSDKQDDVIVRLKEKGYKVVVAEGADVAYGELLGYVYGTNIPTWLTRYLRPYGKN